MELGERNIAMKDSIVISEFERTLLLALGGDSDAQFSLGLSYCEGSGCERNKEKAVEWWKRASSNGNLYATYFVGMCYLKGEGVKRSYWMGMLYLTSAKEKGCGAAGRAIDRFYAGYGGIREELVEFVEWCQTQQGTDERAKEAIKELVGFLGSDD